MNCSHCNKELELNYQSPDFSHKIYACRSCDKWFEVRKQKARLNAAVPISFSEIDIPDSLLSKAA